MNSSPESALGLEVLLETIRARFEVDALGRILASTDDGDMPRFVLGRAEGGCIWRFRTGLASDLVRRVARLAGREPGFPNGTACLGDPQAAFPPERLVMIERLFAADASTAATSTAAQTRHEWVTQNGVCVAELWLID